MSNRKDGTAFEAEFCEILAQYGFWCHNLAQKASGQPFDVIIARHHKVYPVDCKVCQRDRFDLTRIEDNQWNAMRKWVDCENDMPWFAMKMSDGTIYMVSHRAMLKFIRVSGKQSMNLADIKMYGWLLEEWEVCF